MSEEKQKNWYLLQIITSALKEGRISWIEMTHNLVDKTDDKIGDDN